MHMQSAVGFDWRIMSLSILIKESEIQLSRNLWLVSGTLRKASCSSDNLICWLDNHDHEYPIKKSTIIK